VVICLERGAVFLHIARLMSLHLLPHLNPDWFYLSVTGLARLSWKRASSSSSSSGGGGGGGGGSSSTTATASSSSSSSSSCSSS